MVNIGNKKLLWVLAILLYVFPAVATFYPAQDIDMEGVYDINNVSYIYADGYCFNDGTCFGENERVGVSMWEVALIIALLGTGFLFVYISQQFQHDEETDSFTKMWFSSMKLLFIGGALLMPILAVATFQGIWTINSLDSTYLIDIRDNAWLIVIWIPVLFTSLIGVMVTIDWIRKIIQRRRE